MPTANGNTRQRGDRTALTIPADRSEPELIVRADGQQKAAIVLFAGLWNTLPSLLQTARALSVPVKSDACLQLINSSTGISIYLIRDVQTQTYFEHPFLNIPIAHATVQLKITKMESAIDRTPRIYRIRRSHHLGYGFIAGHEQPTLVKIVEPNGPSFQRLLPGDLIMAVNGIDVETAPREKIIKMIQLSQEEIEIKVRQPTYEEILKIKNLTDARMYMHNKNDIQPPNAAQRQLPSPISPKMTNFIPMNRLVTSIAQQRSNQSYSHDNNNELQQVQALQNGKTVLKQRSDDNGTIKAHDGASTLGRNSSKYGRHSPLPQRCKSSMSQNGQAFKNLTNGHDNQSMLKRSNTMRPFRPPAKVMEIFETVIRIFFEDGHTRVLNYKPDTTVGAILEILNARLVTNSPQSEEIKRMFGLTLTVNSEESSREQQANKRKLLHILDEDDSIMKIRQLPYAPKLRLLYRIIYPPADVSQLYSQDKVAFEYLYKQSCNDLRLERFCPEPDSTTALKLGALHLVEYVYSNYPKVHGNSKDPKLYIKLVKKSPGISHFLPMSFADQTSDKKGRKNPTKYKRMMQDILKSNFDEFYFDPPQVKSTTNLNRYTSTSFHELSLPELQSSPSDYVKLLFLTYLSQLPCYEATRRPARTSTSPVDRISIGDCSSSIDSAPRTSDSSPLLKQDHNQAIANGVDTRGEQLYSISRLAHMNSIRSLSHSVNQPVITSGHPRDQVDMAQTPSIESISSITFNMQNTPSPQPTPSHLSHNSGSYTLGPRAKPGMIEPMPRYSNMSRTLDSHSIDKIYSQRYPSHTKPIDELLKSAILLPPPPASARLFCGITSNKISLAPLTPVLTDRDLEGLKVPPPPPRMTSYH